MPGHRVTETRLFKLLRKRESSDGFDAAQISSKVNAVIEEAWPLLHQIARSFPFYTLHDPEHSFRVAQHMFKLIPKETISELNAIELSILLYAAYLHDIGMASNEDNFQEWLNSPDYGAFLAAHDQWASGLRAFEYLDHFPGDIDGPRRRKRLPRRPVDERPDQASQFAMRRLQDAIYTDFLRENHATRGAEYICARFGAKGKSDNKIQISDINYADHVALVCKSHYDSAMSLRDDQYRRDMYIATLPVNLQYCAILLRLADLIDLDPDRAPRVLVDFLALDFQPGTERENPVAQARLKSAEEWAKHRSVLGYKITPDEIRIEAKCEHPAVQRGLREWCDYIDIERRDCRLVVQENRVDISKKYQLLLTTDVRKEYIQSDGSYVYTDFQFQLDYDRIVKLLMGTELWGDPSIVIRELLQNAIDACHHRQALSKKLGVAYTPQIAFRVQESMDNEERAVVLKCEDNGMGMDQHIIENFLMRIGRSYYESSEFRGQNLNFFPISHFGMGIMSCFMLTDTMRIETQRVDESLSRGDCLSIEIDSSGRYVVLRRLATHRQGTTVALPMRHPRESRRTQNDVFHHSMMMLDELSHILESLAVHADIPITVDWHGDQHTIEPGSFRISDIDWSDLPCIHDHNREFRFDFSYDGTGGLAGTFRFILPCARDGTPYLGLPVDDRFQLFIDPDGDVCLTTPTYKDERLSLPFGPIDDDWDDDEVRGIYRDRFNRKPRAKRYDGKDDLLEIIKGSFRWSQDGLLVAPLETSSMEMRRKKPDDSDEEKKAMPDLFTHVPVPGLNAVDIDMRGPWRVALNVQRTTFDRASSMDGFVERYYRLASEMWKQILEQLEIGPEMYSDSSLVSQLFSMADWQLRTQLQKVLGYQPNERHRAALRELRGISER